MIHLFINSTISIYGKFSAEVISKKLVRNLKKTTQLSS